LPDTYHTAGHRAGTATSTSTGTGTTSVARAGQLVELLDRDNRPLARALARRDVNGDVRLSLREVANLVGQDLERDGRPVVRVLVDDELPSWLTAAAYDRWLMTGGLSENYGTQYRSVNGHWVLHEVDATTTDEERARWDVPPLAEALRRAGQMSCDDPPQATQRDGPPARLRDLTSDRSFDREPGTRRRRALFHC